MQFEDYTQIHTHTLNNKQPTTLQAQLKELFRLADPDHSKSIDLDEFRLVLADLHSLETEPERFQRRQASRFERSAWAESSPSIKSDKFGLFSGAFSRYLKRSNLPWGDGHFRIRPMSMSCVDDLPRKCFRESSASFFREAADVELGSVDGGRVVAGDGGRGVAYRHTSVPSFWTAVVKNGVGVEQLETKTDSA